MHRYVLHKCSKYARLKYIKNEKKTNKIAGYSAGVLNSFVWNKCLTLKKDGNYQNVFSQFGKFLFVNGLSLGSILIGLAILIDYLYIPTILLSRSSISIPNH
jgi:putative flippase GtrA